MKVVNTWGYATNGSWSGLAGFLQREEIDVGATSMFALKERLPILSYIASPTPSKSLFLFRPPPLSFVNNIFTLPFSRSVWLGSAVLIALIGFLLYAALKWETRNRSSKETQENMDTVPGLHGQQLVTATWSDILLLSIGAVCQQGSPIEARGISGRTITIALFITVIFLYTSYSACIVALLQSTTDSIHTLDDLYHSGLAMGAVDLVYSRHFFSVVKDPLRRAIYTEKINHPGSPSNFLTLEEGVARVRKGLFAFHHEVGPGYKIVSDTFLEEEKCGLQTIVCFPEFINPWIAVSKQTPLKEVITIGYRIIHERGLQMREHWRFYQKKPKCSGSGSSFVSVGIVDCYPALLVLLYGIAFAIALLLFEIVTHRRCQPVMVTIAAKRGHEEPSNDRI